jgi:hypothetical protein
VRFELTTSRLSAGCSSQPKLWALFSYAIVFIRKRSPRLDKSQSVLDILK